MDRSYIHKLAASELLAIPVDDMASLSLVGGLLSVDSLPAAAVVLCTSLQLSTTTAADALYANLKYKSNVTC